MADKKTRDDWAPTHWNVEMLNGEFYPVSREKFETEDSAIQHIRDISEGQNWPENEGWRPVLDSSNFYLYEIEGSKPLAIPKSSMDQENADRTYKQELVKMGLAEPREIDTGIPLNTPGPAGKRLPFMPEELNEETAKVTPTAASGFLEGGARTGASILGATSGAGLGALGGPASPLTVPAGALAGAATLESLVEEYATPHIRDAFGLPQDTTSFANKFGYNLLWNAPELVFPASKAMKNRALSKVLRGSTPENKFIENVDHFRTNYGVDIPLSVAGDSRRPYVEAMDSAASSWATVRPELVKHADAALDSLGKWFDRTVLTPSGGKGRGKIGEALSDSAFGAREFGSHSKTGGNLAKEKHQLNSWKQEIINNVPRGHAVNPGTMFSFVNKNGSLSKFIDPKIAPNELISSVHAIESAMKQNADIPFGALETARKYFGDKAKFDQFMPQGMNEIALTDAYGAIKDTMREGLETVPNIGKELANEWDTYNKTVSENLVRRQSFLKQVYKGESPEQVYKHYNSAVSANDATKLEEMFRYTSREAQEDLAYRLIVDRAADTNGGGIDIMKLSRNWNKIEDDVKDVVYRFNPELRKQMDLFVKDIDALSGSTRHAASKGGLITRSFMPVTQRAKEGSSIKDAMAKSFLLTGMKFLSTKNAGKLLGNADYVRVLRESLSYKPGGTEHMSAALLRLADIAKRSNDPDMVEASMEHMLYIDSALNKASGGK